MASKLSCTLKRDRKLNDFTYSRSDHFEYFSEKDYDQNLYRKKINATNCDIREYQELLVYAFIKENIKPGSKILGIGRNAKLLRHFKNEYECWNIDCNSEKYTGVNLVKDSIGNFNKELPDNYFDFIFSVSGMKDIPEDELSRFKKIYEDIDRVSKINSHNVHCFEIVIKEDYVWTNKLIYYFFSRSNPLNDFVPFDDLASKTDIFILPEKFYEENWRSATNVSYKDFGKPLSYNIIWKKEKKTVDLSMETFLESYKKRLPLKSHSKESDYTKKNPTFIFHHLIKCGGTSIFNSIDKWFQVESDYKPDEHTNEPDTTKNINLYNKYKLNFENFSSDVCIVSHFNSPGSYIDQRYPEVLQKKDSVKIFTFVREPLEMAISLYYYKLTRKDFPENYLLTEFLEHSYNVLSIQFPCSEKNYKEVLERYFFIGIVERMQGSLDKLASIINKRKIILSFENKSERDLQAEEIKNDTGFIEKFKKRNYIDYLVYEYCKDKYFNK